MGEFLLVGTVLGAAIGLVHAIHLYRRRLFEGGGKALAAAWFALWALALWTLFGAYVLAFWILGAVWMGLASLTPARRTAR